MQEPLSWAEFYKIKFDFLGGGIETLYADSSFYQAFVLGLIENPDKPPAIFLTDGIYYDPLAKKHSLSSSVPISLDDDARAFDIGFGRVEIKWAAANITLCRFDDEEVSTLSINEISAVTQH